MRRQIKTLAFAFTLAAMAAAAQTNPISRNSQHDSFYYGAISGERSASLNSPLGNSSKQIEQPTANFGPVTAVPERSEWAMVLAGLALVGYIVRRTGKRP